VENGTTTAQRPAWRTPAGSIALVVAFIAWFLLLIGGSDSTCSSGMSATDILAAAGFFAATPLAALGVGLLMRWRLHPWRSSIILVATIIAAVVGEVVTLGVALNSSGCFD
jgi:hypothetical protein